jgi:hypothetical protein
MVDPQAARHQLDLRLDEMRLLSRAQLSVFPSPRIEEVRFGSEEWSLTTYVELEKDQSIRVVVQIGPPQPKLVLLRVQADGFRVSPDGRQSRLAEHELFEFM